MLTRRLCGSGMGSSEQGEYCSSVFCSDLDRLNCNKLSTLYFGFTFASSYAVYSWHSMVFFITVCAISTSCCTSRIPCLGKHPVSGAVQVIPGQ